MNTVVSFPDSGRTWLRAMLLDLGIEAEWTHDGAAHMHAKTIVELDPDKSRYRDNRVLLLVRDPRDTTVSGYFQVTRRLRRNGGTMSEFLRNERHGIAKVVAFNKQWFAAGPLLPAFMVAAYEELQTEPGQTLRRVAQFFGGRPTRDGNWRGTLVSAMTIRRWR